MYTDTTPCTLNTAHCTLYDRSVQVERVRTEKAVVEEQLLEVQVALQREQERGRALQEVTHQTSLTPKE